MIPSTVANDHKASWPVIVCLEKEVDLVERVGEVRIGSQVVNGADLMGVQFVVKDAHVVDISGPRSTGMDRIVANHKGVA